MWSYYKQQHASGNWSLFREDEQRRQQIYHRQKGWRDDNELFVRCSKGEVDEDDRISELEALGLIRSLPAPARSETS